MQRKDRLSAQDSAACSLSGLVQDSLCLQRQQVVLRLHSQVVRSLLGAEGGELAKVATL